eukprot:CAMPEP_0170501460 /NCGR_PEP_ID=MMETSP0208-20121228/38358_1 /TAXON_ID=197538 /ORGANISM="Strombidium inclinatum, Strain S3" /LENGTH=60 /DNA_ID=CAMNT_0010780025 /DNA_START=14 /DNA_END=196 /DNA_ORIENTATION=-
MNTFNTTGENRNSGKRGRYDKSSISYEGIAEGTNTNDMISGEKSGVNSDLKQIKKQIMYK